MKWDAGQINNFWVKIKIGDVERLTNDCTEFEIYYRGEKIAQVKWNIVGKHNMHNAPMAIAAAHHVGISVQNAANALSDFVNVKRRLELKK